MSGHRGDVCYHYWSRLILTNGLQSIILHSKEGITQGDPMAMILYGISVLPIIRTLKDEYPELHQPWYADDAGLGGTLTLINECFTRLKEIGPTYGYYPEPTKSKLIVSPDFLNIDKALNPHQFKTMLGSK